MPCNPHVGAEWLLCKAQSVCQGEVWGASGGQEATEPVSSLRNDLVWALDLRGGVPEDVKFTVRGPAVVGFLESGGAFGHDFLRNREGIRAMLPIGHWRRILFPEFRADLISGNLAN